MDELFAVDAEARHQEWSQNQRHTLRQEKATPLVEEIRNQIKAARSNAIEVAHQPIPSGRANLTSQFSAPSSTARAARELLSAILQSNFPPEGRLSPDWGEVRL